ncbi:MAG: zinc ABC transporter substrate-binding protein [Oscillospiraceae bacterium]|nr:zinc ABC transporter substrate-binding protein [Oscillospiraceae bacterium]
MKRVLSLVLALGMLLSLAACSGAERRARVQIVTTCFPIYDWTRNIVGDTEGVEITWLMDSGVDPHSFQPTVKDLTTVSDADLFVYVGGESEAWANDAAAEMKNPDAKALALLSELDLALEEEAVPGAEQADEEPGALDEHIWMSLRAAARSVDLICEALCGIDSANDDVYRMNAEDYTAQLNALDQAYGDAVASSELDTILVADRFPFRYLAEDYGLKYYAAFAGCSAETEASFQTVLGLSQEVDTLGLPVILVTENGTGDIAEAVSEGSQTEPAVRTLDSLQSVTAEIAAEGVTYLSVMEQNLEVLKEALGWH